MSQKTAGVLVEVAVERERQDKLWGEQNHPDGTGDHELKVVADALRMRCDEAAEKGELKWIDILEEEVAEAFAESDPAKLREELLQVAAVAIGWVEAIDRRTKP